MAPLNLVLAALLCAGNLPFGRRQGSVEVLTDDAASTQEPGVVGDVPENYAGPRIEGKCYRTNSPLADLEGKGALCSEFGRCKPIDSASWAWNESNPVFRALPKLPLPHPWSSPERVVVGCEPALHQEYCWFWARVFARAVFPGSDIVVVQQVCNPDDPRACAPPVGAPPVDIQFGLVPGSVNTSSYDPFGMHSAAPVVGSTWIRDRNIKSDPEKKPGYGHWDDGILWPSKVASHSRQRPFIVAFNYEIERHICCVLPLRCHVLKLGRPRWIQQVSCGFNFSSGSSALLTGSVCTRDMGRLWIPVAEPAV